jgi:hypothetical protein
MGMNLREAIEDVPSEKGAALCSTIILPAQHYLELLAAAKRVLAEEEAKRPKRASLEEMERHLRTVNKCYDFSKDMEIADILKSLREFREYVLDPPLVLGAQGEIARRSEAFVRELP